MKPTHVADTDSQGLTVMPVILYPHDHDSCLTKKSDWLLWLFVVRNCFDCWECSGNFVFIHDMCGESLHLFALQMGLKLEVLSVDWLLHCECSTLYISATNGSNSFSPEIILMPPLLANLSDWSNGRKSMGGGGDVMRLQLLMRGNENNQFHRNLIVRVSILMLAFTPPTPFAPYPN